MTTLNAIPCPCGCRKFIVQPLFNCQCSSLRKEDADELVRRWNDYERLRNIEAAAIPVARSFMLVEGGYVPREQMEALAMAIPGKDLRETTKDTACSKCGGDPCDCHYDEQPGKVVRKGGPYDHLSTKFRR